MGSESHVVWFFISLMNVLFRVGWCLFLLQLKVDSDDAVSSATG